MKNGLNFGLVMEAVTVTDYDALTNKPSINGVPLVGNKTGNDLNLVSGNGTYDDLTAGNVTPKRKTPVAVMNLYRMQTTGGDADLLSGPAFFDGIKGNLVNINGVLTPFIADSFVSTGLNLVDSAEYIMIGGHKAYVFPVPMCAFGTYGTTEENNGIKIFGETTPTAVYFKTTKPTEDSYGSACPYTTYDGVKYYTPSSIGWMAILMPDDTVPAAHMEWSGTNENTPGTFANIVKSIAADIQAVHTYGLIALYGVDRSVYDELDYVNGKGYGRNDRGLLSGYTWVMTTYTEGDETPVTHHVFRATVSAMAMNGLWNCLYSGLVVEGNTLVIDSTEITSVEDLVDSFTANDLFYFEKAAVSSVNLSGYAAKRENTVNDYGLSYFMYNGEIASVPAYVTEEFYQSGKDELFNGIAYMRGEMSEVIAAAIAEHEEKINGILTALKNGLPYLKVQELLVARKLSSYSVEGNFFINGAGAPSVLPQFSGQHYFDTTNNVWYVAGFTGSAPTTAAWKQITNA